MPEWCKYETAAAELFRELRLQAEHNQRVAGTRSTHQVDVLVTTWRFGVKQMWIVECKGGRRPVEKRHVMTLAATVDDVGADRGFLLSESGFQSGAVQAARKRNITLTSLADLRANAANDLMMAKLTQIRQKVLQLSKRQLAAVELDRNRTGNRYPSAELCKLGGHIEAAARALNRATMDRWPVLLYRYEAPDDFWGQLRASNLCELVGILQEWLDALDRDIRGMEKLA